MTKRQRATLCRLRELVAEYQQYIPYVQDRTIIEVFNYIGITLYGVLVDRPDNDELEYNLKQVEDSLHKFEELLKYEKSIG